MSSSVACARRVTNVLVFLCCGFSAWASQQLSISEIFAHSRLLANFSNNVDNNLVQGLTEILRTPSNTRLRVVHELQHGRMAHTFLDIMKTYATITADNMPSWLQHLANFLDRYSRGVCPVHHGDMVLMVKHTASSGLPMLRRAIFAKLATAWLTTLGKRIPDIALEKLGEVILKLYRIHKDSVIQKGVMEYFHISKAGGTSWNSAAKLNGCVRARSAGSHVKGFGDECRWMDQNVYRNLTGRRILWGRWGRVSRATRQHGCRARYDYVASKGFSYISNEYTIQGGHDSILDAHICPQFVNVVTLRDPIKRMESNIRFIMMHIKVAHRRHGKEDRFNSTFCNASAALWEALGPPITDNYIVRSFLGVEGFHTPLGHISAEHVAAARDQLLQFDLVLDLDAGPEANDRFAQQGLGWSAALSAAHALDSSILSIKMQLNYSICHPEQTGLETLFRRQGPDQQLYRFGRIINQLDELWLDLSRALGEKPEQQQCGMLFRGSNNSALASAIARMTGRLSSAGKGGMIRPEGGQKQQGIPDGALDSMDADSEVEAEAEADMDGADLPR
ncbi:hypothetical protein VaNZ11_013907 [Volvox africanus]|uniref:Sulfotransferase n=1 Tax=Volvox africanus TaxID=51714 RepID=A0ABQ5SI30_9CHLO|nr:hypothetical protein VaNZ11_013907 [Volvox africanus]